MHAVPLTEWGVHPLLDSCPFITERRTCWPVSDAHWAASGTPIAAVVSEGQCPVPFVCAELVTRYYWLPWFLVVIHLHREDVALHNPSLFFPRSLAAVPSSPNQVQLAKDPLSAQFLRPLVPDSAFECGPSPSPLKIVSIKVTLALLSMGSIYSAFVRGC